MKSEDYNQLMSYISIINKRFNTLKLGMITDGLNVNNILYINYPYDSFSYPITITGLIKILDESSNIEDNTKYALNIEGGVNVNKNLYIGNNIINEDECLSWSKNMKSKDIYIGYDLISNINDINTLNCEYIEMHDLNNDLIISNELIINVTANLILESNTNAILNVPFLINYLKVNEESIISVNGLCNVDTLTGNFDINSMEITSNNINSYQLNIYNLTNRNDCIIRKNIQLNNMYIENYLKLNKTIATSNINNSFLLTGIFIQRNPSEILTSSSSFDNDLYINNIHMVNNNEIYCKELFFKLKIDTLIYVEPLYIGQTFLQLTTISFFFQGIGRNYSFILSKDIVFENPSNNFNILTYYFDIYSSDLLECKPKYGFYFLVGGFRSSVTTIYYIIYRFNFFDYNSSQINITIEFDSNNENYFVLGYVYRIYKFNCNYLI